MDADKANGQPVNGQTVEPDLPQMVEIKLKWEDNPDLQTIYVNHIVITHTGPEFYLIFGEVVMPATIEKLNDCLPTELSIVPKVRLAISPEQMKPIAEAIYNNVQKYLEKKL